MPNLQEQLHIRLIVIQGKDTQSNPLISIKLVCR